MVSEPLSKVLVRGGREDLTTQVFACFGGLGAGLAAPRRPTPGRLTCRRGRLG